MKKSILAVILSAAMALSGTAALANESDGLPEAAYTLTERQTMFTGERISVSVHIEDAANIIPQNMVFGIYNADGQFLGARHIWVADVAANHKINFEVPQYYLGDTFYLKLFSGAAKIQYASGYYNPGDMIPLETYTYVDESGDRVYGYQFSISATPVSGAAVKAYANGWELYFKNPAKVVGGVCMIPMFEYLDALEMRGSAEVNNDSGRIDITSNGHKVTFFLNGNDMYTDDKVTYSETTPMKINGVIYVPFRFLVEGLGGTLSVGTENGCLKVSAELRGDSLNVSERFVNDNAIRSKTDYLIWVSKSKFTVTVFKDMNGIWKEQDAFQCSIGAPSTPTITGQFEYFSREARWSYPTYYVGPIMRFYKGYALHSTLLRYDGSNADGRLGKRISHGCVRLAPANINWMVDNIPLHTKVYVTEQ